MEEQTSINQGAARQPSLFTRIKNNKKSKLAFIIIAAVVLIGGGSAAAYYAVIVPNQPENLLKKSIENTLKLDKVSGDGRMNFTGPAPENEQVIIDYKLKSDSTNKTAEFGLEAAYSGVKLPVDIRSIDKSLFVRVGDLGSIKGVAELAQPGSGALVDQVAEKVSNQWIEIDETLLNRAVPQDSCDLNGIELTDKDIDQILALYDQNTFVTIKSTSDEKVGDKDTKKLDLALNEAAAKEFGNQLKNTDIYKRIEKCDTENQVKEQTDKAASEDFKGTANFAVWVDTSSKQIAKLQLDVQPENEGTFNLDFTFNDEEVNIQKPDNAKPAMEVIGELSPLFGGLLGAGLGGNMDAAADQTVPAGDQAANELFNQCMAAYQAVAASGDISALPPECQNIAN